MERWKRFWDQFEKSDQWKVALIIIGGTLLMIAQIGKIIVMLTT